MANTTGLCTTEDPATTTSVWSRIKYPLLAQSKGPAYFWFMVNLRCAKCGAGIVPGTRFCRSCGTPVESQPEPSEMPTAVLDEKVVRRKTQRFEARTTAEASDAAALRTYGPAATVSSPEQPPRARAGFRRSLIIVALILVTLLGVGVLVGVMKRARHHSTTQTQVSPQFNYPGARIMVNVGGEGGGVLQLESTDRLDKVSSWYASTLKPTKTLQVNAATVIMKNDKITVTMAATDEGTSIVIKQLAP